jgi:hypothetical protein
MLAKPSPSTIANALRSFQVRILQSIHSTTLTLHSSFHLTGRQRSILRIRLPIGRSLFRIRIEAGRFRKLHRLVDPRCVLVPFCCDTCSSHSSFIGDGIGPEISQSVKEIYNAAKVSFSSR